MSSLSENPHGDFPYLREERVELPRTQIWTCPLCEKKVTGYPSLSRPDNDTKICSTCGQKEAMDAFEQAMGEVTTVLGCTTIVTTLTSDDELGELHIGRQMMQHGMFGWYPTIIEKHKLTGKWYVTATSGGYPLESHKGEYAVPLENTYTLLVYLSGEYIPPLLYKTLTELIKREKRDIYLVKSQAFTLSQSPMWHTIYHLCELTDNKFSFLEFEEIDESCVQVHLHSYPDWVTEREG